MRVSHADDRRGSESPGRKAGPTLDGMDSTPAQLRRVVIIGAGFAGLECARTLSHDERVQVTVVDKNSYQLFSPLLYQVATGGLPEDDIAYPVRAAVEGVKFLRAEVADVHTGRKLVRTTEGDTIAYDDLVLAVGAATESYGIPGVAENTLPMKTLRDARTIRNQLLGMYEKVESGKAASEDLNVVVVGGGPTGVELSGAIAELQRSMSHQYPDLDFLGTVSLVEAGPRILPMFADSASVRAQRDLEDLGVQVHVNAAVDRVHASAVRLKNGHVLTCGTTIWAAGVRGKDEFSTLGEAHRSGRLRVDEFLRTNQGVWVVGDGAYFEQSPGAALPMVAPVALQMGRHAAKQISAQVRSKEMSAFSYTDKGQMATIGRRRAVVQMPGGHTLFGTAAWFAWLVLHVFYLAGGRNRASVIADWMWNYLLWNSGPRPVSS